MSSTQRFAYFMQELADIYPGAFLQRAARLWPERLALICDTEQITFKELYDKTRALTHYLINKGVTPTSRIIILYENSITFYYAYYGAWQTGAVIVPVNTFLQSIELEHIINDCDAHFIIASEKQAVKIPETMVSRILTEKKLFEILEQTDPEIIVPVKPRGELAALLYTSGTTGLPKGVMLNSTNIITNAVQAVCEFTISSEERIYAALPLFHSYLQNACLWSAIIVGATTIIVPKIDRTALIKGLQHQPTAVLGIPQLFGLFCLLKNVSFPRAKFFFSGGDALPDKIRIAFELTFRRKICNGYGLTEAGPVVSVHLSDDYVATNCVGKPVLGLEVALLNEDGTPIDDGIGILALRGDNIMMGYYNAPQATQKTFINGWLDTGDLATIAPDNTILICGRKKDLIINKGINIYPQEVENVIMSHPEVTNVAVVGLLSNDTEVPVAFVAVRNQRSSLTDELMQLCTMKLAPYKVPRAFYIEKELAMTATGKVDKKVLRKKLQPQ